MNSPARVCFARAARRRTDAAFGVYRIQIKREQYAKALEYARAVRSLPLRHHAAHGTSVAAADQISWLQSLKLDPSTVNIKAKFREGQALIGLGQATAGRIVLEEIQTSLLGVRNRPQFRNAFRRADELLIGL